MRTKPHRLQTVLHPRSPSAPGCSSSSRTKRNPWARNGRSLRGRSPREPPPPRRVCWSCTAPAFLTRESQPQLPARLKSAQIAPRNECQTSLCRPRRQRAPEPARPQRTEDERTKMKRKDVIVQKTEIRLDPRYASARPWDWWLCRTCEALIPHRCPRCGSDKLTHKSSHVIRAALTQFGRPPFIVRG